MVLAYIDPVSGTMLLQLLVAGIVGMFAFFRKSVFGSVGWLMRTCFGRESKK